MCELADKKRIYIPRSAMLKLCGNRNTRALEQGNRMLCKELSAALLLKLIKNVAT